MEHYLPGPETDLLLLQWWARMTADDELRLVFADSAIPPSAFLRAMQTPTTLLYEYDREGVCAAAWFEPMLNSVALSLWTRKDWRGRRWWAFLEQAMRLAFESVNLVIFFTKHHHVVESGQAFGFETLGKIPHLHGGENTVLCYLTKDRFKERHNGVSSRLRSEGPGQG